MRHNKLSWATAFAAGLLFIAVSPAAKADSTLTLSDGAGDSVSISLAALITDTSEVSGTEYFGYSASSFCTGTCSGAINFEYIGTGTINTYEAIDLSANLGNWSVTVDSGIADPPNGSGNPPLLIDLDIQATYNGAGSGTLTGNYDAGIFNASIPGFILGAGNANSPATVTDSAYVGGGPSTGTLIGSEPGGTGGSFADPTCSGSPCSTTNLDVHEAISGATNGQVISDDLKLSSVPEPTSIVLLGGALLLAGRSLRKKFQKVA